MPDTNSPKIDHRVLGRIRAAMRDVSPRLIEDATERSEQIRFKDVATGDTYEIAVAETTAVGTARPPAPAKPGEKQSPQATIMAGLEDSFAGSGDDVMSDVKRDGDGLVFSGGGKHYRATAKPVTQTSRTQPQPAPAAPAPPAPAPAPQAHPATPPAT